MTPGGPDGFDRLMADAAELGISAHEIRSCLFTNRPVSYWRFDGSNYFVAGSLKDPEAAPVIDEVGRPAMLSQPTDVRRLQLRAEIADAHAQKCGVNLVRSLRLDRGSDMEFQVLATYRPDGAQGSLAGVSFECFAPFKMVALNEKVEAPAEPPHGDTLS